MRFYLLILFLTGFQSTILNAQNPKEDGQASVKEQKIKICAYDGTVAVGYVDFRLKN